MTPSGRSETASATGPLPIRAVAHSSAAAMAAAGIMRRLDEVDAAGRPVRGEAVELLERRRPAAARDHGARSAHARQGRRPAPLGDPQRGAHVRKRVAPGHRRPVRRQAGAGRDIRVIGLAGGRWGVGRTLGRCPGLLLELRTARSTSATGFMVGCRSLLYRLVK